MDSLLVALGMALVIVVIVFFVTQATTNSRNATKLPPNSFHAQSRNDPNATATRRSCPYCAEAIKYEASVCPFCRKEVQREDPPSGFVAWTERNSKGLQGCGCGLIIVSALLFGLLVVFLFLTR